MDKTSQTSVEARRSFLKKVAYAAPVVVALGALSTPKSAHAGDSGLGGSFKDMDGKQFNIGNRQDALDLAKKLRGGN